MKRIACVLWVAVLLLVGCAEHSQNQITSMETQPTVKDIFTDPIMPATTVGIIPTPSDTIAPDVTLPSGETESGSISFGPISESEKDEFGVFRVYAGGQMYLPFSIEATGTISSYDVGILIFIDGVVQPYQIGPDGEYAYMHTFSQKDGTQMYGITTTIADVYFTPITGEKGDVLEIYAVALLNPGYLPSQGEQGFAHTFGAVSCGSRLKYNATPPEDTYPEKSTRLLELNTSVVDCSALDILGWSDTDLIELRKHSFKANGQTVYAYGVQEDEPVTLRYQVWGTPYVHYGLVFFVDNEPVYAADGADILVSFEMGKKVIIEAKLDMTGFSGESAVYAILVPRNYRTSEVRTRAWLEAGPTIYLLEKDA